MPQGSATRHPLGTHLCEVVEEQLLHQSVLQRRAPHLPRKVDQAVGVKGVAGLASDGILVAQLGERLLWERSGGVEGNRLSGALLTSGVQLHLTRCSSVCSRLYPVKVTYEPAVQIMYTPAHGWFG